jgi:hypothetical protein
MRKDNFFPLKLDINPKIYAYEETHPEFRGLLKIGYTEKTVKERVAAQYPISRPIQTYKIVLEESAMKNDGTIISDHQVRKFLINKGFKNPKAEWIKCNANDVKAAIISIKNDLVFDKERIYDFKLRPEQELAIKTTFEYFNSIRKENKNKAARFLWNAKMRFGKTFAAYHLAKKMKWSRILVLTYKLAAESAWEDDLTKHVDFTDWKFIKSEKDSLKKINKNDRFVCFGSFQDFLGKNSLGGIKLKNSWAHEINWDCIMLDEFHWGSWRKNAQDLFDGEEKNEVKLWTGEGNDYFDEELMPITTNHYLYLSGTPFRALTEGEFLEEQIYNWTYVDEQKAKMEWTGKDNPYESLPKMIMLTYKLPNQVLDIVKTGEFNEFDLNTFFSAKGEGEKSKFIYEEEVQKWLDFIRGSLKSENLNNLKDKKNRPILPFSNTNLQNILQHTLWFLPRVNSCFAMKNLLDQKQNIFFKDYKIIVAAGSKAGMGVKALYPVLKEMDDPLKTKTITLTCRKLIEGVTVRPWSGIFILRNTSSLETYFQAAFRVQSPWSIANSDLKSPNKNLILKEVCYVIDFAPNRALRLISSYCSKQSSSKSDPEKNIEEFINFLPILAYDGSRMSKLDAAGIMEIVISGTTGSMLAKRWESDRLINVDDDTLTRLINNQEAMEILEKIEAFRNLNKDIQAIINSSEIIKKIKKNSVLNEDISEKDKKTLSAEEKERKSKRDLIRRKLKKFATRIPVFMYLTDYRERTLKDVISELEPGLFNKVVGIKKKEFHTLLSLGVFNSINMNESVFLFKRYEDSSLSYLGKYKHEGKDIGLWDTVITADDYLNVSIN